MVASYLESMRAGFAVFVGVGALVVAPLVVIHYLRFGRVEPRRAYVLYALLAYGIVALALIFLPFPDPATVCRGELMVQTTPFQWVTDMRHNMAFYGRSGIGAVLRSSAFLQQAFNVALFVPLGMVLRKAYGRGPISVLAIGLGISLAVEIVQQSGNFGYYPCPYRIADVDDLISNSLGAVLGWMLAPVAVVVPEVLSRDRVVALPDAASVPRRLCAAVVDFLPVLLLAQVAGPWWAIALAVVIRVVLPSVVDGHTIGNWLLRYRIRAPHPLMLLSRELLGATGALIWAVGLSPLFDVSWRVGLDVVVVAFVVVGSFVVPVFRRDQRGWPDQVTGTRPTRTVPSADPSGDLVRRA
ncbi:hypothetical protein FKR81_33845 [Lentzea tibetensis]|uniref:VanZ-like domain-containing protein n=1 Tax=Lentzea tibetensis TaxID=2591470 RepID=A0A563EJM6_9PSEU|nr:VanZ family protein [Lentzea tibetensis]TWP47031.1 hypothetical protein FKR81_33845 [Lentzea tibetensis]